MRDLLTRIGRYLSRRGARDLVRLIPSEPTRAEEPEPPPPTPPGRMRLHLFGANFETDAEAIAFCTGEETRPSALNRQLDGAFIDPAQVEVIREPIVARLAEFLTPDEADDVLLRLSGDDTLIVLTEEAFGGLPYTLDDTADLTYLGTLMVRV